MLIYRFPLKLFALFVVDPELQEMKRFHRVDLDLASQFLSPLALFGIETLSSGRWPQRDGAGHPGISSWCSWISSEKFILHQLGEENGRLCLPASAAGGTVLGSLDMHLGTNPLTGDLHQSKFTQGKDVVLGLIRRHGLLHPVEQLLLVLMPVHVDKIHHNDATHIPQPQLAGNLHQQQQGSPPLHWFPGRWMTGNGSRCSHQSHEVPRCAQ